MRTRSKSMVLRFTPEEMEALDQKVAKSQWNREQFCRMALEGVKLKEAPPADYYKLIMEVRKVGTNINQILNKANTLGFLDMPMLQKALEDNHATEDMLWDTFTTK